LVSGKHRKAVEGVVFEEISEGEFGVSIGANIFDRELLRIGLENMQKQGGTLKLFKS
jgi:hypothetical protein